MIKADCRCSRLAGGGGHAKVDGAVGAAVDLGELVVGAGEADLQSLDFAKPAFAFGFGDAVVQVAVDLFQPPSLRRVWPRERAPDTSVLTNARRGRGGCGRR